MRPHGYCVAPISLIGGWQSEKQWETIVEALKAKSGPDLATARKLHPSLDRLIKLLERDKLSYSWKAENVVWHTDEYNPPSLSSYRVRVEWSQENQRKSRKPAALPKAASTPLTAEQCRKAAAEAAGNLAAYRESVKRRLHNQTLSDGYFQHEGGWEFGEAARRKKQKAIGHAVARIVTRHGSKAPWKYTKQDYAEMDAAAGVRVRRESQLPTGFSNWLQYIVRIEAHGNFERSKSEPVEVRAERESIGAAFEMARADVEYWRELERLTETRQRYAPGADCANESEDLAAVA